MSNNNSFHSLMNRAFEKSLANNHSASEILSCVQKNLKNWKIGFEELIKVYETLDIKLFQEISIIVASYYLKDGYFIAQITGINTDQYGIDCYTKRAVQVHIKAIKEDEELSKKGRIEDFYCFYLNFFGIRHFENAEKFCLEITPELETTIEKLIKRTQEKANEKVIPEVLIGQSKILGEIKKFNNSTSLDRNQLFEKINKISESVEFIKKLDTKKIKYSPKLLNKFNQQGENAIHENISENSTGFISGLFDELIQTTKLTQYLNIQIEIVINNSHKPPKGNDKIEFSYAHRAILAGALAISILQKWNLQKVIYLHQLSQLQDEPYVSERAIIGLVLALIKTWKHDVNKFNKTLDIMSKGIIKKDAHYRAGIFETLDFFLLESSIDEVKKENPFIENNLNGFQLFEPPHKNMSYYKIENDVLKDKNLKKQKANFQNIDDFILRLNNSYYLNYEISLNVVKAINNIELPKFIEIINILDEEKDELDKSEGLYFYDHKNLWYSKSCTLFYHAISSLNLVYLLNFKQNEVIGLLETLGKRFQYGKFIKYLPISRFELNHNSLTQKELCSLPRIYLRQALSMNNDDSKRKLLDQIKPLILNNDKIDYLPAYNYCFNELENYSNKYEQAITNCEDLLKFSPNNKFILRQIGWYLIKLGRLENNSKRYEQAISKYEESLKIEPSNADALRYIGWCLIRIGKIENNKTKYKQAIEKFKESLKIEPSNANALRYIGWCLIELGETENNLKRYEQAISKYEESLKIEPSNANALRYIGWCLIRIGKIENNSKKYEQAISKYEASLKIEPSNTDALRYIGWCLIRIGEIENNKIKYKQAIEKFKESLKIEPNNTDVIKDIGWCYLLLKNSQKSKKWYEKAFNLVGAEYAHMNYGHCELILKNKESAIKHYKKSLDIWKCSEEFFEGFDDDFKYLEPQGVDKDEYEEIKQILRDYCEGKDKSD